MSPPSFDRGQSFASTIAGLFKHEVMMNASTEEIRIDACVYILHGLLQRLERQQPGLLAEMIEGMTNDQVAMATSASGTHASRSHDVAGEAIRMLRLANDQLQMTVVPPKKA